MIRHLILIIGIILTVIGIFYCICYLNYISFGYSFIEYGKFICRRCECLMFPVGCLMILGAIFIGGD